MNRIRVIPLSPRPLGPLLIAAFATICLSGCFSHAVKTPPDSDLARQTAASDQMRSGLAAELASVQMDPQLADRAPTEIKAAALAVSEALESHSDAVLSAHLVYIADRKIKLARAVAETKLADDQRAALVARRDEIHARADVQAAEAEHQRLLTAQSDVATLRQQVAALQPVQTGERMTLVLPEVLLEPGRVNFSADVAAGLDAVSSYLTSHPGQSIRLEGRTPGRASDEYALRMSQSRADGVRGYLQRHSVGNAQITAVVGLAGETVTMADGSSVACNRCVLATLSGLPPPP